MVRKYKTNSERSDPPFTSSYLLIDTCFHGPGWVGVVDVPLGCFGVTKRIPKGLPSDVGTQRDLLSDRVGLTDSCCRLWSGSATRVVCLDGSMSNFCRHEGSVPFVVRWDTLVSDNVSGRSSRWN